MLKVALVGVGGISGAHIPAWKNIQETELVAICDIREGQMAPHENVRKYTDLDEMLEREQIDILDICLPTYLHADAAIKAMNKGIHVICEKPISLEREDVKRVYDAAKRNHVRFMVAQVVRFWDEYEYLKNLIDSGKYGKLISGNMRRLGCIPQWSWDDWMRDENRSGLVPFDLHIHDCDFMVYALGTPKSSHVHRSKRPDQDYLQVTYDYGDFFITAESSWYAAPYPFTADFRFQFENAVVVYERDTLTVYEVGGKVLTPNRSDEKNDTGSINLPKTNAYENEIRYFTSCVLSGDEPNKVTPDSLEAVIDVLKSL